MINRDQVLRTVELRREGDNWVAFARNGTKWASSSGPFLAFSVLKAIANAGVELDVQSLDLLAMLNEKGFTLGKETK